MNSPKGDRKGRSFKSGGDMDYRKEMDHAFTLIFHNIQRLKDDSVGMHTRTASESDLEVLSKRLDHLNVSSMDTDRSDHELRLKSRVDVPGSTLKSGHTGTQRGGRVRASSASQLAEITGGSNEQLHVPKANALRNFGRDSRLETADAVIGKCRSISSNTRENWPQSPTTTRKKKVTFYVGSASKAES